MGCRRHSCAAAVKADKSYRDRRRSKIAHVARTDHRQREDVRCSSRAARGSMLDPIATMGLLHPARTGLPPAPEARIESRMRCPAIHLRPRPKGTRTRIRDHTRRRIRQAGMPRSAQRGHRRTPQAVRRHRRICPQRPYCRGSLRRLLQHCIRRETRLPQTNSGLKDPMSASPPAKQEE